MIVKCKIEPLFPDCSSAEHARRVMARPPYWFIDVKKYIDKINKR